MLATSLLDPATDSLVCAPINQAPDPCCSVFTRTANKKVHSALDIYPDNPHLKTSECLSSAALHFL